MLKLSSVTAGYGEMIAIRDVSLEVQQGEIVAIIGANGAGKSTILRTISGLVKPVSGSIEYKGKRLDSLKAHQVPGCGIAHVPEGRRLFAKLTAMNNLLLGALDTRDKREVSRRLGVVFELFPILKDRQNQRAGTMSGGEQQMLAIGRGLMLNPTLLMLDEPSLGVAPVLVERIMERIVQINKTIGTTILLVEQNSVEALEISSRAYVLQTGEIVLSGSSSEVSASDTVRKAYLGL